MLLKRDVPVVTAAGDSVGRVDRVVIDPETHELTHIVARTGLLARQDRLIPVAAIASTTEHEVRLHEAVGDAERFPAFEETHFIHADDLRPDTESGGSVAGYAQPLFWYPIGEGSGQLMGTLAEALPGYLEEVEQHLPPGTIALKEGAHVISRNGTRVGTIEEILTEPRRRIIVAFTVASGTMFRKHTVIPASWVGRVEENEVHLRVGDTVIESVKHHQAA